MIAMNAVGTLPRRDADEILRRVVSPGDVRRVRRDAHLETIVRQPADINARRADFWRIAKEQRVPAGRRPTHKRNANAEHP